MSKHIELVKKENLSTDVVSVWEEIDGWEEPTHTVRVLWRVEDGEDRFSLGVEPKIGKSVEAELTIEEMQQVVSERHTYSFMAPKVGHAATINALGIVQEEPKSV